MKVTGVGWSLSQLSLGLGTLVESPTQNYVSPQCKRKDETHVFEVTGGNEANPRQACV